MTKDDTETVVFTLDDFYQLEKEHPHLAKHLHHYIIEMLAGAIKRQVRLPCLSAYCGYLDAIDPFKFVNYAILSAAVPAGVLCWPGTRDQPIARDIR